MNKSTKNKIKKAAERYGKREARKITYNPENVMDRLALESAFLDGIQWYLRNKSKLEELEALDLYFKICKTD